MKLQTPFLVGTYEIIGTNVILLVQSVALCSLSLSFLLFGGMCSACGIHVFLGAAQLLLSIAPHHLITLWPLLMCLGRLNVHPDAVLYPSGLKFEPGISRQQ